MRQELLEAEAVEEPPSSHDEGVQGEVRRLPERARSGELEAWRGEVKSAAIAAAGGLVAGMATVAVAKAARGVGGRRAATRAIRRQRRDRPANVVASRSFLIDVHVLGR
jgi:hypothetical protein